MWFEEPARRVDWNDAIAHLCRDRVLRKSIARVGPCTLAPRRDYFVVLCQSIYTQQISTKIATILFERFRNQFPQRRPTPQRVIDLLSTDSESARACGLSRQKKAYLIDLAKHFLDGRVATRKLARCGDEEVIEMLTNVNGIGRWTAEMFLIFVLNRTDVLPVDDLGLREGVKRAYHLSDRPKASELRTIGEPWRPFRSIATWYLWRSLI